MFGPSSDPVSEQLEQVDLSQATAVFEAAATQVVTPPIANDPPKALVPSLPLPDEESRAVFGVGAVPAAGKRRLLTVMIDYNNGKFVPPQSADWYRAMTFTNSPSVSSLYDEMSGGRLQWLDAGTVGPIRATDDPATACVESNAGNTCPSESWWYGVVGRALTSVARAGTVDFRVFDRNGDGTLTSSELQIQVVEASGGGGGSVRNMGCIDVRRLSTDAPLTLCSNIASFGSGSSLFVMAHELAHALGLGFDLYNDAGDSGGLTLLSSGPAVHLDPESKLRLGWADPVAYDIASGVGTCIRQAPAARSGGAPRPILLYDSRRGTNEYFMIEHRARIGHDAAIPSEGIAAWHVKLKRDGWPSQTRGVRIYSGPNGVLDSPINTADAGVDRLPWGRPDGVVDTIFPGVDGALDSVATGDDEYSRRNFVLTRGVPASSTAVPNLGGSTLWKHANGTFRLQWNTTAIEAGPVTLQDAGFSVWVGRRFPGDESIGVAFWRDDASTFPINTTSIQSCLEDVADVTLGGSHTCARTNLGRVFCFGNNENGALGDAQAWSRSLASPVAGGYQFAQVDAGGETTCGVTTSGSVFCWGSNTQGQLGNGDYSMRRTPTAVAISNVNKVVVGEAHTCAIHSSGQVSCWGANTLGQVGIGNWNHQSLPVQVLGLSNVSDLALGATHSCAVTVDRQVWCWGSNNNGELGVGDLNHRSVPTRVAMSDVVAVGAGRGFSCFLNGSGAVRCSGRNDLGQLGNAPGVSTTTPSLTRISGVSAISVGSAHACANTSAGAMCWGRGAQGELGSGYAVGSTQPRSLGMTALRAIEAGGAHTCLHLANGRLVCTGQNTAGQLGDGSTTTRLSPVTSF
jgi:M6 family metalloprotease-like protein